MKKPKRRFDNANQIRDEMDRFKEKARKLRVRAASYDAVADEFVRTDHPNTEMVVWNREQANKCRKQAGGIENRTLVRLKEKMAEWLTPPLPGVGIDDRSIQARG